MPLSMPPPSEPDQFWLALEANFEAGEAVFGEVVGHNRGGLIVTVEGKRGFVPVSQITELPPELRRGGPEAEIAAQLQSMYGSMLALYIVELNWRRNRLILSRRHRPPRPVPPPRHIPPPRGDDSAIYARLPKRPITPADHAIVVPDE